MAPPRCPAKAGRRLPVIGCRRGASPLSCPLREESCPQAPFSPVHSRTSSQPTSRASSWGSRRGAVGWPRPGSSAYPVPSLQSLLTAALDTRLAPDCSRAGQGRGQPVLWGQLWSRLFPLGVLKQMLHALHLQPAPACLHLWALGKGPQGHLCSLSPSGRWRRCQALEAHLLPLARQCWGSLGPVRLNTGLQWVTWGPGLLLPLFFTWTLRAGAAAAPHLPQGQHLSGRASHPGSTPGTCPLPEYRAFSGPGWPVHRRRRTTIAQNDNQRD